jgi:hypothetical protein
MKIINRTTVPFSVSVFHVPASSFRISVDIGPNQVEVLKFTDSPPPSGIMNVYDVYRFQHSQIVERLTVPEGTTIIFATDIQTGLFPDQ